MTFSSSLVEFLATQKGSRFARITYTNKNGETFRETLNLGADYGRMLRDNYALLLTLSAPEGSIEAQAPSILRTIGFNNRPAVRRI